jgi:hypothetical protein
MRLRNRPPRIDDDVPFGMQTMAGPTRTHLLTSFTCGMCHVTRHISSIAQGSAPSSMRVKIDFPLGTTMPKIVAAMSRPTTGSANG